MKSEATATIAISAALSDAIDMSEAVGNLAMVKTPAAWTAASIGFYVCEDKSGTFAPLRSATGAIVEISGIITNAAGWYPLPTELAGARWVKIWSQTSGSSVNQDAARTLIISMKG